MTLNQLITKCLQNDRNAQRALYERYKDNLFTVAYRICGDFDLSHDLLQETFIAAFKGLSKLNEPDYFYSWIRKILIRKTYATLKSRKRTEDIDALERVVFRETSSLDIEYIEQAIQQLPFKSRTVFIMATIEGFSHKDISEALDISVGTSKSQLNFAKEKLKSILSPYLAE